MTALQPATHRDTFTGAASTAYSLAISDEYRDNEITITPTTAAGFMVVRAKARRSSAFEDVKYGVINLATSNTLKIHGHRIKTLEFKTNTDNAFTVYVEQSNHS